MQSRMFAFSAFTVGRLGVPIFMFITGYLLLDRDYDDKAIINFWKRNLLPLLATTEIWIVLYDIFLKFFYAQLFKWNVLIKNLLFLEQVKMGHMWYMSMVIGVYLFVPFVARAIKNIRFNVVIMPFIIAAFYLSIIPLVNNILIALKKMSIWPILNLDFSGGYYGLIFMAGYLYKRFVRIDEINGYKAAIVGILSYGLVVGLQLFFFGKGLCYPVWYNWFPLLLAAASLAIVATKISRRFMKYDNKIVDNLGKCAFGVYLVHYPLLMALNKYCLWPGTMPVKVMSLFLASLTVSFTIVLVGARSNKLKTILFYIK